jgi:glycosyltransferase involved in cell wall biosynthesis
MVPDFWDVPWQPRHHVMSRLAQHFPVVWLEPPHQWRDAIRTFSNRPPTRSIAGNLWIHRPEFWLPQLFRPAWLATLSDRTRVRMAVRQLRARGCRRIVLYVWRPDFHFALDALDYDMTIYHVDDEYSFSSTDGPVESAEARLLTQSDQVIVHSPALFEKKGKVNASTMVIPNGVDFLAYSTPKPEPADIASIPHPRIGYTGYLKPQLDWPLIERLTGEHPEWSFVFVGAPQLTFDLAAAAPALAQRRNVHILGAKSVVELSNYPQHFDCCMMPYRNDNYTRYIYPMKLHEYLAGGRPVVGRRIRSLQDYEPLISVADDADEWTAAIRESLSDAANTVERRKERQAVASDHDWNALTLKVARVITERLGDR